jgi:hypothetical protein
MCHVHVLRCNLGSSQWTGLQVGLGAMALIRRGFDAHNTATNMHICPGNSKSKLSHLSLGKVSLKLTPYVHFKAPRGPYDRSPPFILSVKICKFCFKGKVISKLTPYVRFQGVGGWGLGSTRMTGGRGGLGYPQRLPGKMLKIMYFVHVLLVK